MEHLGVLGSPVTRVYVTEGVETSQQPPLPSWSPGDLLRFHEERHTGLLSARMGFPQHGRGAGPPDFKREGNE